jgi:alpha-D-xyloside xylohydrolase
MTQQTERKTMLKSLFIAGTTLCALSASVQAATISMDHTQAGMQVRADDGVLTIEPYSDRVIHVRFGPAGYTGNYNPAVIATPAAVNFKITESADAYTLSTAALQVRVARPSGAVSFLTPDGKTVLQEGGHDLSHGVKQGFHTSSMLYGLGQHQNGLLDYNGTVVHLQQVNRDVAVPMLVSPKGFGVLWNNASVTDVEVGMPAAPAPLEFRSEAGGGVDYDFIYGPELDDVIGGYRQLTGAAPMMARWTWGLWQSKEHYATQDELLGIAAKYRQMHVPLDAVVQDWQYWTPGQWGSHVFDASRYPDPAGMIKTLHGEHVHAIISVWARLDAGTANAAELDKAGALFPKLYPNVYPAGHGRWYDAWNPTGRKLYWNQIMRNLGKLGFDGWWLDASEAELGGNWGEMRDVQTAAGPGSVVFNSYPLMHTTAVHDGMVRDQPEKRAFILTRSAYAGQQRNAAITWSGDTEGNWDTFRRQVPAALNFTLSGIPYWSADIGGFFSHPAKDPNYAELFTRWFQFGVFNPMFRVHGTGANKEVWNFDPATQKILIDYIKLRYRLLPYIYSASWDVTSKNGTMMRALAFDFRDDQQALTIPDQYMFGKALLVAPVVQAKAKERTVYLPGKDAWFDFWTGAKASGGQVVTAKADIATIPVFVRAGSIVPLGPVKQYADAPSSEPTELRVYPGKDGSYTLYDDAGDGYAYQHGKYALVRMTWNDAAKRLDIAPREGSYDGMPARQHFSVRCGTGAAAARTVVYDGKATSVSLPRCGS